MTRILDELERLQTDDSDVWGDKYAWEAMKVLPALIRVARAAEERYQAEEAWHPHHKSTAGRVNKAERELEEALQQLRNLGGTNEQD